MSPPMSAFEKSVSRPPNYLIQHTVCGNFTAPFGEITRRGRDHVVRAGTCHLLRQTIRCPDQIGKHTSTRLLRLPQASALLCVALTVTGWGLGFSGTALLIPSAQAQSA